MRFSFEISLQVNKHQQNEVTKPFPQKYSSSEESDESMKDTKKLNKIVKSEQKNKIVRNIFLNVSKTDGGAKGKGQVMIVDHSEDAQKPITNISRDYLHASNINIQDSRLFTPTPIICRIDLSRLTRIPNYHLSNQNNTDTSKHFGEVHLKVKNSDIYSNLNSNYL